MRDLLDFLGNWALEALVVFVIALFLVAVFAPV
jgi:hypothetical protein